MPDADTARPEPHLLVACLCAAWCGTCRDYRATFDAAAAGIGAGHDWAWVDIEDHDEVPGPLDIENFPTLLIARDDTVLFFGTVTPQPQTLERLLRSAVDGELHAAPDPGTAGLPQRVRALGAG